MTKFVPVVLGLLLAAPAFAADHQVTQSAKAFSTTSLKANVGDTVSFRNDDAFVHNIFSLSDTQTFDLGTFAKGETRQVKLEKAGMVLLEPIVEVAVTMPDSLSGDVEYAGRGVNVDVRLQQSPESWLTATGYAPLSLFRPSPDAVAAAPPTALRRDSRRRSNSSIS